MNIRVIRHFVNLQEQTSSDYYIDKDSSGNSINNEVPVAAFYRNSYSQWVSFKCSYNYNATAFIIHPQGDSAMSKASAAIYCVKLDAVG